MHRSAARRAPSNGLAHSITLIIFNRFTRNFDRIFKTKLSKEVHMDFLIHQKLSNLQTFFYGFFCLIIASFFQMLTIFIKINFFHEYLKTKPKTRSKPIPAIPKPYQNQNYRYQNYIKTNTLSKLKPQNTKFKTSIGFGACLEGGR